MPIQIEAVTGQQYNRGMQRINAINAQSAYLPQLYAARKAEQFRERQEALATRRTELEEEAFAREVTETQEATEIARQQRALSTAATGAELAIGSAVGAEATAAGIAAIGAGTAKAASAIGLSGIAAGITGAAKTTAVAGPIAGVIVGAGTAIYGLHRYFEEKSETYDDITDTIANIYDPSHIAEQWDKHVWEPVKSAAESAYEAQKHFMQRSHLNFWRRF